MPLFLTKALVLYLGCLSCLALKTFAGFGPVAASALTGLAGSFLDVPRLLDRHHLHALVYSGAFIGMGSTAVVAGPGDAAGISVIAAAVYLLLAPVGVGAGGKMGTVAFVASLIFFIARRAL
jgi:hypothetical protein